MITKEGNIILFDNGIFRASPFERVFSVNGFSRAVEYSIDESSMEVSLVWEVHGIFGRADFRGVFRRRDKLPETGNVLMTFAGDRYRPSSPR